MDIQTADDFASLPLLQTFQACNFCSCDAFDARVNPRRADVSRASRKEALSDLRPRWS